LASRRRREDGSKEKEGSDEQRFPEDRRAWFRVLEDVLDDPRFEANDWILGAYVRLLAMLKRARSRDGRLYLSDRSLKAAFGRDRVDIARKRLALAANVGLMSAARYADYTLILVPKWPIIQGFRKLKSRDGDVDVERDGEKKGKKRRTAKTPRSTTPDPDDPTEAYDAEMLVRMLGAADRDAKLAWLRDRLPQIVPAARARLAAQGCPKPSKSALNAGVRERLMAFWTAHRKRLDGKDRSGATTGARAREERTRSAVRRVAEDA